MFSNILFLFLVCFSIYSTASNETSKKYYLQKEISINKDSANKFIINKIILSGNKITKPQIIYRELLFREKDTIGKNKFTEIL